MKAVIWTLVLSMQFSVAGLAQETQRPMHHTDEGFRNYPVIEDPPSLVLSFTGNALHLHSVIRTCQRVMCYRKRRLSPSTKSCVTKTQLHG